MTSCLWFGTCDRKGEEGIVSDSRVHAQVIDTTAELETVETLT